MARIQKPYRWLGIALLGLSQLPMLAWAAGTDTTHPTQENRALAKWPAPPPSSEAALAWPRRFQQYFDDHFALRSSLTYVYSHALYYGLAVIPFGKVRVSESGWVFENVPDAGDCEKH